MPLFLTLIDLQKLILWDRSSERHASYGWEGMGKKVDGRCSHYLRFADDIVIIAPNIERAEQSLAEFDSTCKKIELRLNLTKTIFMRSGLVPDAPFKQNGTNISGRFIYVYLSQEVSMMNDRDRNRAEGKRGVRSIENIEGLVKETKTSALILSKLRS
uniref:Reverse transcriptase domain-containing protein n=1 Tax=Haemonchus contortus TaxID=6289 RepID=A0A7I4Z2U1_HAECO